MTDLGFETPMKNSGENPYLYLTAETIEQFIQIKRNAKARFYRIKISQNAQVMLVIPYGGNMNAGLDFVHKKALWIHEAVKQAKSQVPELKENARLNFNLFTMILVGAEKSRVLSDRTHARLDVQVESRLFSQSNRAKLHAMILKITEAYLQLWGKELLLEQAKHLASEKALSVSQFKVRSQSSLWGSCSASNTISLNIHLMRLDKKLRDYVICHELAHVIHKNHGREFWRYLNQIFPGAKAADKILRRLNPKLLTGVAIS